MQKKQLFFLLFSMNLGGVEKSLLGLLSLLDREEYDIHIGLLRKEGALLDNIPSWVVVHECFKEQWDVLNRPPLLTIKSFFYKGNFMEAIMHLFLYIIYKVSGDRTLFYKYILRKESSIDICFDKAYAYAGPASMLDYYICRKIKAKEKYGWIHYDIKGFGIDKVLTRKLYKEYQKVYVVSETAKSKFDELFPEFCQKTEVRYNVVSKEQILSLAEQGDTFTDDFQGTRILTVGRLSQEKGQDVAVSTLKMLVDKGCDVKWYFVGEGNLRTICEQKASELGVFDRVVFLGLQTNPYGYMKNCDIYVQPSRHEGYCITLAEARCFTVPIVATNFTGAEEQLRTYPQSVVTGMAVEEVANGVLFLLSNKSLTE